MYSLTRYIVIIGLYLAMPRLFSQVRFDNYDQKHGLSQNSVKAILKDKNGFLWFGTDDGLNRFDGYVFDAYFDDPLDSTKLTDSNINCLLEGGNNILWIGTANGGLNRLDITTGRFSHFKSTSDTIHSISSNRITTLAHATNGSLWVGTDRALYLFDPDNQVFQKVLDANIQKNGLKRANDGTLWVGTNKGLLHIRQYDSIANHASTTSYLEGRNISGIREISSKYILVGDGGGSAYKVEGGAVEMLFDSKARRFPTYEIRNQEFNHLISLGLKVEDPITDFHPINDSTILVGMNGAGVYLMASDENGVWKEVKDFYNVPIKKIDGFPNNNMLAFYADNEGILWMGTDGGGVIKASFSNKDQMNFGHVKPNTSKDELTYHDMGSFYYDEENGELWVALWGGGIDVFDIRFDQQCLLNLKRKKTFNSILDPNGLGHGDAISIIEDDKRNLWVATEGGGVYIYDRQNQRFRRKSHDPEDLNSISNNEVYSILKDSNGQIWVGTINGLNIYQPETDDFRRIYTTSDTNSLSGNQINCIYEDRSGNIWIGTSKSGLNLVKQLTETELIVERFQPVEDQNSISDNSILGIYEDAMENFIWIGTEGGGLNRLSKSSKKFKTYTTKDGLPNNVVYGILEDRNGHLWMSTNQGLVSFNPDTEAFKNYTQIDGLQSNEFNRRAYLKLPESWMLFGGINGFNYFKPECLPENDFVPPVAFTEIRILDKPLYAGMRLSSQTIQSAVSSLDKLTLSHLENIISVSFSSLSFQAPIKNQYAYMLEGFDADWLYTDASRRYVTYTNLDPGTYTLKVKGTNNFGYWSKDEAQLILVVLPPPWKTWWAYTLYAIILLVSIGLVIRAFIIRERLTSNLQLEQMERKKIEELDQLKSNFFTGISHEFRTPLTLISSPVEELLKKNSNPEVNRTLHMVKRNASRLLRLINQLLDLSKLEAGKLKLSVHKSDIISWLKIVVSSFQSLADAKKITFNVTLPDEQVFMFFDKAKLEQILTNLLSNSFKFASAKGIVQLVVQAENDEISIEVSNDGEKIPAEEVDKIFDRFYQVSHKKSSEGSGIGLALVKEFVELHHGYIKVNSNHEWTQFIFTLPTSDKSYAYDEKIATEETSVSKVVQHQMETSEVSFHQSEEDTYQVLIVEDNQDLRSFVCNELSDSFGILEAPNGSIGLETAISAIPDLIITDVMMPEMDGIELLQTLRADARTNHIPIIMLTAKAEKENRLEGLEKGADHYLAKPFEMEELRIRAKSLINQREKIRDHYYAEFITNPSVESIPSADDQFLALAVEVIDKQLQNDSFTVDEFASELAMSRVQLHRKLKATIGCSSSEFIRQYRLKKAYQYLEAKKGSVSQIAYSVGFSNLSYFTKTFKEIYQINPSELLK